MQITVELPDSLVFRLQQQGLAVDEYLATLAELDLKQTSGVREVKDRISVDEFARRISEFRHNGPPLSAEALTREAIYQDHD